MTTGSMCERVEGQGQTFVWSNGSVLVLKAAGEKHMAVCFSPAALSTSIFSMMHFTAFRPLSCIVLMCLVEENFAVRPRVVLPNCFLHVYM